MTRTSESDVGVKKIFALAKHPLLVGIASAFFASFMTWWITSPELPDVSIISGEVSENGSVSVDLSGDVEQLSSPKIVIGYRDDKSSKGISHQSIAVNLRKSNTVLADDATRYIDTVGIDRLCRVIDPCPSLDSIVSVSFIVSRNGQDRPSIWELSLPSG